MTLTDLPTAAPSPAVADADAVAIDTAALAVLGDNNPKHRAEYAAPAKVTPAGTTWIAGVSR
ncbi:hypothetical protein GCM10011374_05080 [Kocuria dechangensis]|uniref:Uncharacterized protein n=1 Tax=Kocuria dechangensis TaxID=1176249 RepID=A0A917LMS3_9MICC|nr:hypothetical protein [Kocuria dechangensis]GGG45758.1 hypothetical protein GCM10011374_05080 [Kocuria dechangensis]